ncbi:MAG: oligosaccharide flippase family protein [Acidimicrobiia bacterium]|nr:oligosaccharide flippase family protein [Acidimicrobiia bacterium]
MSTGDPIDPGDPAGAIGQVRDADAAEFPGQPPSGGARSNRGVLGRGASTSFVLQTSGIALQYATQVVLARTLGVGAFGTYTYALTWSRMAAGVCQLGGTSSSLRLIPQHTVEERWDLVAGLVRRFRQVALGLGVLITATASAIILAVDGTSTEAVALVLALGLVPVTALIELQVALTRALESVFRAYFPWLVLQPALLIATVGVFLTLGSDLDVESAVLLTGGSYLFTMVLQAWWLHRLQPPQVRSASPTYATREWLKLTLPIFGSNVVYLVFQRLDVVMVGLLRSPLDAGVYAVAMRAGTFANIFQTAMAATLAPRISRLFWSDRRSEVEHMVLMSIRWTFLPTLALTAALCGLADPILDVFGPGFSRGETVLILTALAQLVSVSSGPVGWLMNMTGHQNITAVVFSLTAVVTVAGYFALIPWLGIAGAAVANGGAVVARNLALNVLARRRLGYKLSVLRSLRAGAR